MTLRSRLFALVAIIVSLTVVLVTATVTSSARRSFAAVDAQRTAAIVAQVGREFAAEGDLIAARLERIAASDTVQRAASDLRRSNADVAAHVADAGPLATAQGLDFLDLVAENGTIVSSAHWPARFGYRHPLAGASSSNDPNSAFLEKVETPGSIALALMARRSVGAADRTLVLIGGRRLDEQFLKALVAPQGMRVLLYRNLDPDISRRQLIDASGPVADAGPFERIVARVRQSAQPARDTLPSGRSESVDATPLPGRDGAVLGVLLVTGSNAELSALVTRIRWAGVGFGALGIVVGFAVSYVLAGRVTRPVEDLAAAARAVAEGDWNVPVDVSDTSVEVGALGTAFAAMTRQLVDQRDRLVQAERVAAWRELARRLAHELKNPLFPLRLTLDNLRRAKDMPAAQFDEVFDESMAAMTTGLGNLNTVIGRFSDFAKMPTPQLAPVSINDIVRETVRLFQAQLDAPGRPPIAAVLDLDAGLSTIQADRDQLGRAAQNLVLNAIDAMPNGGELTIRTRRSRDAATLDVSDTGQGLTDEERKRLFTPYYTTKRHGTGLGLAIVQSVVADHAGKISVESEPGRGTTFHIELPA